MPAGRELDAWIAEQVMGFARWSPLTRDDLYFLAHPDQIRRQYRKYGGWSKALKKGSDGDRYVDGMRDVPEFSTDIAAAWQVVEKFRSEGWKFCIADGDEEPFQCYFQRLSEDGGVDEPEAEADTAQLAICRAALKAAAPQEPPPPRSVEVRREMVGRITQVTKRPDLVITE